jgi:hypothetical protein
MRGRKQLLEPYSSSLATRTQQKFQIGLSTAWQALDTTSKTNSPIGEHFQAKVAEDIRG